MIAGYEKAWAALLGGLLIPSQTLALALESRLGWVPVPPVADITAASNGLLSALLAGALAYIATTSDTTEPHPIETAP